MIDILANIKVDNKTAEVGVKITEADEAVIAEQINILGLAVKRKVLSLLFESGVDVGNSQLKQLQEDLSKLKEGEAPKEIITTIEESIKLAKERGEN